MRVRSTLTKPTTWSPATAPSEPDSYQAIWFKLTHQAPATRGAMDPFAEPVKLVLPV